MSVRSGLVLAGVVLLAGCAATSDADPPARSTSQSPATSSPAATSTTSTGVAARPGATGGGSATASLNATGRSTATGNPSATASATYPAVPAASRVLRDLDYAGAGSRSQLLDLYLPKDADRAPLVVFVHGGAWFMGDKALLDGRGYLPDAPQTRDLLLRNGFAVASVNYRLSSTARYPAQLDDVRAAVRHLASRSDLPLDGSRIALFGESAGGHLAALAALIGSPVRAVVSYYGVSDLRTLRAARAASGCTALPTTSERMLLGVDPTTDEGAQVGAEASPITHVHRGAPPFLLVHGTQDCTVPAAQSERLARALREVGVEAEYVTLDASHAAGVFWSDAGTQERLVRFLEAHL